MKALTRDTLKGVLAALAAEVALSSPVGYLPPMQGHIALPDGSLKSPGFMRGDPGSVGGLSQDFLQTLQRRANPEQVSEVLQQIQRGEITDVTQIVQEFSRTIADLQRNINTGTANLPVRENLEADAKDLTPRDTPVRNMLARTPGSGVATAWRQLTTIGGGWGASDQPGGGAATRMFFQEIGVTAPAEFTSTYAAKSTAYKLMGAFGSVTGFSIAAGKNFQNQLATERTNSLRNFMLNEENALINGSATTIAAPWGDGTTAMGFDGLVALTATANGVPAAQVQTAVGALTLAHLDAQLVRLYKMGGEGMYMIMNATDILSIVHLMTAAGQVQMHRILTTGDGNSVAGLHVTGYVHPITGQIVKIIPSRFLAAGTILYGCERLPDGSPSADVNVLPQVELPQLAPNQMIQGYTLQELAPTLAAPQNYYWMISVYEVLRMKAATVFAKSTGVTAV